MKKILLATILLISGATYAQNVGIGTKIPDPSAILELNSTSKGLLLPRLKESQRNAIPSPKEGLIVYQNDGNKGIYIYQSGRWNNITSLSSTNTRMMNASIGTLTPYNFLLADGNGDVASTPAIVVDPNTGNIGLGTSTANFKFDILTGVGDAFRLKSTSSTNFSKTLFQNDLSSSLSIVTYGSAYASGTPFNSRIGAGGVSIYSDGGNLGVGTISYNPLILGVNNEEVMRLSPDQNVGIGTTSPVYKFDILTGTGAAFRLKSSNANNFSKTTFENDLSTSLSVVTYGSTYSLGSLFGVGAGGTSVYADGGNFGIGTLSNHPLIIGVNNSEVIRVSQSQKVGIGTTNPIFKFDILTSDGAAFRLKSNSSSDYSRTAFENNAGNSVSVVTYGSEYAGGSLFGVGAGNTAVYSDVSMGIGTLTNYPLLFGVNNYEYARISTNGNLLVGGTSDDNTARLNVTGSIKQSDVTSKYLRADANGKLVAAAVSEDNSNANANLIKIDSKSAGYLAVGDFTGSGLTSFPSGYRMIVQDGILTERMNLALKSSQSWADYVFEPSYRLMPLNEVEEFVKENKHLPNVPSADEMVQKGLDVAQTSKMFMEKIEELTLYMIELKKEVEALKVENSRLK